MSFLEFRNVRPGSVASRTDLEMEAADANDTWQFEVSSLEIIQARVR